MHLPKDTSKEESTVSFFQPFRFLDLPPEIRNQIASMVLISDEPIRIRQPKYNRHPGPVPEPMFLSHPRLDFPLPRTPPPTPPGEVEEDRLACAASRSRDGFSRLALLMACRQIRLEHWAVYYSANIFSFTPSTWPAFNSALPAHCLDQLRHVRMRMPYRSRHIATWRALGELARLETIDVVLAPPNHATRLERMNCIQGVRFCENLRRVRIEREGIGEGIGPLADEKEKKEITEDRRIEKGINRDLAIRWKRRCRNPSQTRDSSLQKQRTAWKIIIMPDERAMDAYFSGVRYGHTGD